MTLRSHLPAGLFGAMMLLPLWGAGPAAAQDPVFSIQATDQCFDTTEGYDACVGTSANLCMEQTPGGYATAVMGACLEAELTVWDARLNDAYGYAMSMAREMDAANGPNAPSQAEALKQMQRAWIPFRDRKCDFEYSQWGGGTGAGPASIACLMHETARQTLYLEAAPAEA